MQKLDDKCFTTQVQAMLFTNVLNFVFPFSQLASLRMKHSRRMPLKGQVLTATAVVGPFSGPQTTYHLWSC